MMGFLLCLFKQGFFLKKHLIKEFVFSTNASKNFDQLFNVKIWYEHGSKSTSIN
jgi:hypothetical protein